MKAIYALVFLALVAVVANAAVDEVVEDVEAISTTETLPAICPDENGELATIVPNPVDCTTYYICNAGRPILMHCPGGLHFNSHLLVCDWPSSANCGVISNDLES